MGIYVVLASFTAKEGKYDEVLRHLKGIRARANDNAQEPGTLTYNVTNDAADRNKLVLYEEYASEQAFEDHKAGPLFEAFFAAVDDILEPGWSIRPLNKVE